MSKLLEEEDSADEEFWNQDFFKEDEVDEEYETESEAEDLVDSDFNESEDEEDEAEVKVDKERDPNKKKLKAPERKPEKPAGAPKPKPKSQVLSPRGASGESSDRVLRSPKAEKRKSTRTLVVVADANREEQKRIEAKLKPLVKKRRVDDVRPMTQEELLTEAAQTEIENMASLAVLMQWEEEVKKKAALTKAVYSGPSIKYHSKGEHVSLSFVKMGAIPPEFKAVAPPYPEKPVCAVTGRPAKYRDPQTGLPYADAAAFKVLRAREGERERERAERATSGGAGRGSGGRGEGPSATPYPFVGAWPPGGVGPGLGAGAGAGPGLGLGPGQGLGQGLVPGFDLETMPVGGGGQPVVLGFPALNGQTPLKP